MSISKYDEGYKDGFRADAIEKDEAVFTITEDAKQNITMKCGESIGIMDFEILEEMRLRKIKEADESIYWQCDMTDWRGCIGTGETPEEAIQSAYDARDVIKEHFWDATQGRIKGLNIVSPSERLGLKKAHENRHDQEMTIKLNLDADEFIADLAKVQKAIEEFSETSSGMLGYLRETVDEMLGEDE